MQFFCVFFGSTFDAVDDDRSADRRTVVLGGRDGSGGEADVAEDAQVCRPTVALRGLVSGFAAIERCARPTQRYVAKRRVLTVRRSFARRAALFWFVRANAAPRVFRSGARAGAGAGAG